MVTRGPVFFRIIALAAVVIALAGGGFFLVLIPLVAGRDPKAAGFLLLVGLGGFGLAALVLPALIIYLYIKK